MSRKEDHEVTEDIHQKTFYRYVSKVELEAIEETGLLRGGRGAGFEQTYWTDEFYASSLEAKARLALLRPPEVRVAFRITSEPDLLLKGSRVTPDLGEPGGGTEWMSLDAVEVEVIGFEDLE